MTQALRCTLDERHKSGKKLLLFAAAAKKQFEFVFLAWTDLAAVLFALSQLSAGPSAARVFEKPLRFASEQLEAAWQRHASDAKQSLELQQATAGGFRGRIGESGPGRPRSVQGTDRCQRLASLAASLDSGLPRAGGWREAGPPPLDISQVLQQVLRSRGSANWQLSESARKRQACSRESARSPRAERKPWAQETDSGPGPTHARRLDSSAASHSDCQQRVVVRKTLRLRPPAPQRDAACKSLSAGPQQASSPEHPARLTADCPGFPPSEDPTEPARDASLQPRTRRGEPAAGLLQSRSRQSAGGSALARRQLELQPH